jgi:signal transduction histidine kinase
MPTTPDPARPDPFSTLIEVGSALCRTLHLRDLLASMMERVREVLDAEACSVMLVDEPSRTLRWEVALGSGAGQLQPLSVPLGEGISGRVAATGVAIRIEDAQTDPRWVGRRYDAATGFTTHSILCVPIATHGRVIGVVQVLNRSGGPFTDDDQRLLEALASMGAVAIENARLYEHLEEMVEERTAALTRALTELRDTQAQLVQSEKMAALGDLVAGVAHEINTPLGAVASNTDLIARALTKARESVADPAQTVRALSLLDTAAAMAGVSRDACQRINEIVRSLRNFARLDEAERKPADLHEGIESTLTLLTHLLKNRITVRRDYGQLPLVLCYPNQLNQVFLNLLVNAAQAIEGQGEILIRTRVVPVSATAGEAAASLVVVEIADTGCGIPAENLKKIFDPGFTTKGVGVGTGLGLAICYRIVRAHQGRIEVDSTVGAGATFRIILPVGGERAPRDAQTPAA